MARQEQNLEYLNASPSDFSDKVQALLKAERAAYDLLKQAKAEVLAQIKTEMGEMKKGKEVKYTMYTRWGQWQLAIGDVAPVKAPATNGRKSLAEFMAEAKAHGFDSKDLDKLLRLKMSGLLDN